MPRDGQTTGAWDGEFRGSPRVPPPTSPIDRAPHRVITAEADVPDLDVDPNAAVPIVFHEWCGWVFVEDAGGTGTVLLPDSASPIPISTGRTVWIGKARCKLGYSGSAPSRPVSLVGCTQTDAMVMGTGGAAAASASSSSTPNGTTLETVEMDGTPEVYLPPVGTVFTVVTLYDGGSTVAIGTDPAGMNINVGPTAQLASWDHYGEGPIYFQGVNTQFINFTNYTFL